ncbi:HNH endonuclease [Mycobacterium seoulense]|uniref:HNH endonuclease n=1 Tax=Mycobacterium seoulense TaxID=386911 RepID=UPI003CEA7942
MSDIDEGAVLGAIELLNDPTQKEFVDSLHFKSATQYRLVHEGRLYDSKAVTGIAHGVATGQFWTSNDLVGGISSGGAAWALRKLGFFIDEGPIYELTQLQVDRTHGKPAPYQYVVLLWAISGAQSGAPRLTAFSEVRAELGTALSPFAIAKTAPDPAMPWFALRDTSWWELQIPVGATGLTDADARRLNLVAGLSDAVHQKVLEEQGFVNAAVDVIGQIVGDEPGYLPLLQHLGLANLTTVTGSGPTATRVNWAWDELVLACDLVARNGWKSLPKDDLRVSALSALLRRQPEALTSADFRSIGSVHRKLENIRSMHPDYPGVPTKGGKTTQQVVDAFVEDPAGMHLAAQALWRAGNLHRDVDDDEDQPETIPVGDTTTEFVSAVEGRVVERLVKVAERNPKLRKAKIAQSRQERGTIACELCGFDFELAYGQLGEGYIHVHHRVPLHFTGVIENKLADLILVCANCHAMIHRQSPWKTPEQLKALITPAHN